MTNKNSWWLAETVAFTALLATIWPLDVLRFWSAVVLGTIFAFCYHKRMEAQFKPKLATISDLPKMTPERLIWLEPCAKQSIEAEKRGPR